MVLLCLSINSVYEHIRESPQRHYNFLPYEMFVDDNTITYSESDFTEETIMRESEFYSTTVGDKSHNSNFLPYT